MGYRDKLAAIARVAWAIWRAEECRVTTAKVDHDAWKTPLELKDSGDDDMLVLSQPNSYSVLVTTGPLGTRITPADAARAAVYLASYATAHGCPVILPNSGGTQ